MIKIENITKTYNNTVRAVDNLNLTVENGEIVGFIGPNGAGKTTTLKMLTGILKPDSGSIFINNYDMQKEPLAAKQVIGYIADSPDMFLRLKELKQGDEFVLYIEESKLVYEVCHIQVVLPTETEMLKVQKGRDLVSLVTCTPYGINTHRLVVTGERKHE